MNKWSASPAIPERSVCAQIFDANGINVVALGATDDDTATVDHIVDAHNAVVERLEAQSFEDAVRTLLDAAGIAMDGWKDSTTEFGSHPLLTRLYIALLAACEDDPDAYQRIEAAYYEYELQANQ